MAMDHYLSYLKTWHLQGLHRIEEFLHVPRRAAQPQRVAAATVVEVQTLPWNRSAPAVQRPGSRKLLKSLEVLLKNTYETYHNISGIHIYILHLNVYAIVVCIELTVDNS